MRSEVPPPGRAMTFPEWSEAIVACVRVFLPDVRAARKGPRLTSGTSPRSTANGENPRLVFPTADPAVNFPLHAHGEALYLRYRHCAWRCVPWINWRCFPVSQVAAYPVPHGRAGRN
jgi:hypothetical protein